QLTCRRALRIGVSAAATRRSRRRRAAPDHVPRPSAPWTRRAEMDRARDTGAARPWRPPFVRRDHVARAGREAWQPLIRRPALLALAGALAGQSNPDPNQADAVQLQDA